MNISNSIAELNHFKLIKKQRKNSMVLDTTFLATEF